MKAIDIKIREQNGQLLIELLVTLFVGGLFLLGATLGIVSIMRYSFETRGNQTAAGFAKDLIDNAVLAARADWHSLYDVAKGSSRHYFFAPDASTTAVIEGDESVLFNDVRAGLVGQWKFDEVSGAIAYNTSGNGIHATSSNTTRIAPENCILGRCMGFDGVASYIDAGTSTHLKATEDVTLSAWVRWNSGTGYIIGKGAGNDYTQMWYLRVNSNGTIEFIGGNATSNGIAFDLVTTSTITAGLWNHLVAEISGTTATIYINGTLSSSASIVGERQSNDGNVYIGRRVDGFAPFNGMLDDVRIYHRSLSVNEIDDLYNSPIYIRYITIENVNRDGSGNISVSGIDDPSTQKITASVFWEGGRNLHLYRYIVRGGFTTLMFTTWSGGSGNAGVITAATSTFATSSNIVYNVDSYLTLATTTSGGWLESPIFDTQIIGGAAMNSLIWQGTQPPGTVVKFQLAPSNNVAGPWNYYGSDGTGTTYFTAAANISIPVTNVHNYRYIRYKVFLDPSGGNTPTVDDVILNWSK